MLQGTNQNIRVRLIHIYIYYIYVCAMCALCDLSGRTVMFHRQYNIAKYGDQKKNGENKRVREAQQYKQRQMKATVQEQQIIEHRHTKYKSHNYLPHITSFYIVDMANMTRRETVEVFFYSNSQQSQQQCTKKRNKPPLNMQLNLYKLSSLATISASVRN